MCDFSISASISRAAKVGDKLVTRSWPAGTTGFCDVNDHECAVCLTPGTEIAFDSGVVQTFYPHDGPLASVAIFRQKDKDQPRVHHDYLEFPDGTQMMLTRLNTGQTASVLQLPAQPKNEAEKEEQKRAEFVG